jgi:GNAT superfamily N-acetyltransferase
MDVTIRPLWPADRPQAATLLDDAVGAGFWGFDGPGEELALVALDTADEEEVTGAALCRVEAEGEEDALVAFRGGGAMAAGPPPSGRLLHVRVIAVAPEARRRGIAQALLARAEEEAVGSGAAAAYLFAWLPPGQPEPAAVPFYLAAGYEPRPDLRDFYAAGSLAAGADCPYCGAPPCRCAARPFVKLLGAA